MKVLLTAVNAKYIHSNLAVYDLRAYAEAYGTGGAQVEIGEYTINHTIDYILEGIYKAKPDVLCFSCYIWNLDYVEPVSYTHLAMVKIRPMRGISVPFNPRG